MLTQHMMGATLPKVIPRFVTWPTLSGVMHLSDPRQISAYDQLPAIIAALATLCLVLPQGLHSGARCICHPTQQVVVKQANAHWLPCLETT